MLTMSIERCWKLSRSSVYDGFGQRFPSVHRDSMRLVQGVNELVEYLLIPYVSIRSLR